MKKTNRATAIGSLVYFLIGCSLVTATVSQVLGETEWPKPMIELKGRLTDIIAIKDCKYISGMTCKIEYNGKEPLPSEIYFTEIDESGKLIVSKTRLIYPDLKPGETGYATFRLRSGSPSKVILEGIWGGAWKPPY